MTEADPWFIEVRIPCARAEFSPRIFLLGPCWSWGRAKRISELWESLHGANTAEIHARIPCGYKLRAGESPPPTPRTPRHNRKPLPPSPPTRKGQPLTEREGAILKLLTNGITTKEIAAATGLSEYGAKFHVSNIMAKLGTSTRTATAVEAIRLGLVSVVASDTMATATTSRARASPSENRCPLGGSW